MRVKVKGYILILMIDVSSVAGGSRRRDVF